MASERVFSSCGLVQTAKSAGQTARVLIVGIIAKSGLDAGNTHYLGVNGGIVSTPPSGACKYLVRLGEGISTTNLAIHLEPPIALT